MTEKSTKTQKAKLTPTSDRNPMKISGNCPKSVDEIEIKFAPSANQNNISKSSLSILKNILFRCCIKSATITSTTRNSHDQARAMYNNLIGAGAGQGKKAQKKLYGNKPGGKVIQVGIDLIDQGKSKNEVISGMEKEIDKLGSYNVSKHCVDPRILNVFDVAPSSIPKSKMRDFESESSHTKEVANFLSPKKGDPSYHFEIPQDTSKNTNNL